MRFLRFLALTRLLRGRRRHASRGFGRRTYSTGGGFGRRPHRRSGSVRVVGCAPGCLMASLLLSIVLTIAVNAAIQVF